MQIKRLYVVTLWAPDVAKTAQFYRDVLGLPLLPIHNDHRPHFKLGETLVVIMQSEGPISQDGQTLRFPCLAFAVDALDPVVEGLQALDIDLPWGIEEDADSRWLMLHDPAGNLIEIAELKNKILQGRLARRPCLGIILKSVAPASLGTLLNP